ncbi:MAG TPA: hypothetical protein VJV04_00725 [Nitrospiraceae bacterium]|nr:hypothetical protein [Nitrospiraceae bacterium]
MRIRSVPHSRLLLLILIVVSLIGLPLLGVVLSGQPIAPYLEFPPLTHHVQHAPFSWPAFLGLALLIAAGLTPCLWRIIETISSSPKPATEQSLFPLWGWLGVLLIALAWWLAWTRLPWFAAFQPFTFTPLWLGYIVVINALTYRVSRACLLVNRPRYLLVLFLVSAAFWWCFEYLNRFVQNWYYVGIDDFGASAYVFYATLSFSTVLPAVVSTAEWLKSLKRLDAFRDRRAIDVSHPALIGGIVLVLSASGLTGIGICPDYLFPLLWVSPLLIITSLQAMLGRATIFSGIRHGDWRPICLPALAGLQCGFFWELGNWHSLAHWEYAIPYVHRFLIFEMPLLGYAGYLPFGLECLAIANLLTVRDGQ